MSLLVIDLSQDFSEDAPKCLSCRQPGILKITGSSNVNGNAGRPYYRCQTCNKFIVFADEAGNSSSNPECDCDVPSRKSVAGQNSTQPGREFFTCRTRNCDFFEWAEEHLPEDYYMRLYGEMEEDMEQEEEEEEDEVPEEPIDVSDDEEPLEEPIDDIGFHGFNGEVPLESIDEWDEEESDDEWDEEESDDEWDEEESDDE
ncbi:hypothetical protein F4805DRAFT_472953 [Annulohypoxylon moriforme]|nr:hypothetical protein F4805DRAFT_472953 [Annulohypoxylon moriforme]